MVSCRRSLLVSASIVFHDEQLAVFDCKIEIEGELVADAQTQSLPTRDGCVSHG